MGLRRLIEQDESRIRPILLPEPLVQNEMGKHTVTKAISALSIVNSETAVEGICHNGEILEVETKLASAMLQL